jgi:hypothetical protein
VSGIVLPTALASANLNIDHVTVAGANLDEMRKAFTAATGVPTEYGGPHSNHATEMALVSFPDGSYLELMGVQSAADPVAVSMHGWSQFLEHNGGPCAFALRVSDIGAEIRELKAAGIATGMPEDSGRTRPDGVKLAWETVNVGTGHRGSFFPFLISDRTPRENRTFPSGKPTTDRFQGVAKVVIGVHDIEAAIVQYRTAFHLAAPRREVDQQFGAALAWFEGTPIVLAQGLGKESWLGRRVREFGDAPCAFVLKGSSAAVKKARATMLPVVWMDAAALGWRLGVEPGP